MRRSLFFLLLVGIIISFSVGSSRFLVIENLFYKSPCNTPIEYKIGSIDSRFGLSRIEVLTATKQAGGIWNTTLGKQLFVYHPQATLTVNMVYDRRQALNTQINQLEEDLASGNTTLQSEIEKYEKHFGDFNQRSEAFGKEVDYWNSRGGASKEKYDALIQEQQSLNDEAERLNAMAQQLNLLTNQYNDKVSDLSQTVRSFNKSLQVKPEEGIYDPNENRIDIYFNNNQDELVRTIAHELGHARGLNHSKNQLAIMYPSTSQFLIPTPDEIGVLQEICRKRPFYEPLIDELLFYLNQVDKSAKIM